MSNWTKSGSTILKDGSKTFLKGVCYSPTPIGAATFAPGVGDWFAPPWNSIWERDFAAMKKAGINNIRTYFFWAWTPPADMTKWKDVVKEKPQFDHTDFLASAAKNGISVTIGIALDGGNIFDNGVPSLGEDYFNFYKATLVKLVELYGANDAVMGFCLGNEQNTPNRIIRTDFWDKLEEMTSAARAELKKQKSEKILLFAMQNDDPGMFTASFTNTDKKTITVPQRFAQIFDAWGVNIYSGFTGTLADYKKYVVKNSDTNLPLIISEWGIPGGKNDSKLPALPNPPVPAGTPVARQLSTQEFAENIKNQVEPRFADIKKNLDFVAGSQWFEWTDEWWKDGWWQAIPTTPCYQVGSSNPDWPENWWGLNAVAPDSSRTACEGPWDNSKNKPYPPDVLSPRPTLTNLTKFYNEIK